MTDLNAGQMVMPYLYRGKPDLIILNDRIMAERIAAGGASQPPSSPTCVCRYLVRVRCWRCARASTQAGGPAGGTVPAHEEESRG